MARLFQISLKKLRPDKDHILDVIVETPKVKIWQRVALLVVKPDEALHINPHHSLTFKKDNILVFKAYDTLASVSCLSNTLAHLEDTQGATILPIGYLYGWDLAGFARGA